MKRKTNVRQKKMGRPVTIDGDRTVTIRLPAAQLDAIDAWASKTNVPRSEAMRQLVDYALTRKK
jgi:predicted DNA binding CopG/RHH family protein